MTDKEKQELQEAISALRVADCDYYADLLERMEKYWELDCQCSIRDGSNPACEAHKAYCPFCDVAASLV